MKTIQISKSKWARGPVEGLSKEPVLYDPFTGKYDLIGRLFLEAGLSDELFQNRYYLDDSDVTKISNAINTAKYLKFRLLVSELLSSLYYIDTSLIHGLWRINDEINAENMNTSDEQKISAANLLLHKYDIQLELVD